MFMLGRSIIFASWAALALGKNYCQPSDSSCWPTSQEIEEFKSSLSPPSGQCLQDFPTYASKDEPGDPINNVWYSQMPEEMSPYDLINLRQYLEDKTRQAFFIVLARSVEDVQMAVKFAVKHDLALSVFGTGHEFQDRNAGKAPNGLLIRTICLRAVNIDLNPSNRFGHPDGVLFTSFFKSYFIHKRSML